MPLTIGAKAPAFTLVDTEKKPHTLADLLGKKTVIAFFPGAFTGTCTKEMCTFRDSLSDLGKMSAQVVAISTDSPFANKAFAEGNRLGFLVLSDITREVSKTYCGLYDRFAGVEGYVAAKRSVFVLDESGTVRYVWISENPGVEPNYDDVKKALASF
jgi:peroxiredoxin